MSEARLILTCGLPGAGKTRLATRLAAERSAVRLTKDEWLWALGSSPWDESTREKVEHELWRLAQEILRLGVSVVLDFGLWARIERDEMRSAARDLGVGVELHFLDVPADELWRRVEARNSEPPWDSHPIRRADLDGWLRVFEAPDAAELALFNPTPASKLGHYQRVEAGPMTAGVPAYDSIGQGYATRRQPDPRFEAAIRVALGQGRVLNVGAGSGSYEPAGRTVAAVEPAAVMISQRPEGSAPAVQAVAEALPFRDASFDVAMAVLTVHHWSHPEAGFSELRRVAPRRVVFCFDPCVHNALWLMDYLPEIAQLESARAPTIEAILEGIEGHTVIVVPVPHDCKDGMTAAYWRRPEAYLDPTVRAGSSGLQQIPPDALGRGLSRLEADLRSGKWTEMYGELARRNEFDCGLRLVVGGN